MLNEYPSLYSATSAIGNTSLVLILSESSLAYNQAADYKTDTVIQTSLRNELKGDVTLITVAHRLQTIIDADKVVRGSFLPFPIKAY